MNLAFLGYGSIAHSHARAITALQGTAAGRDLRLYGVMGRLEESTRDFAREYGMALATTDLDALLADGAIDAVLVCSPTDLHDLAEAIASEDARRRRGHNGMGSRAFFEAAADSQRRLGVRAGENGLRPAALERQLEPGVASNVGRATLVDDGRLIQFLPADRLCWFNQHCTRDD